LTEWDKLVAEVERLREENKLYLEHNKRLIDENTELEDKLDDNAKLIDRLAKEKLIYMDLALHGCQTISFIQEPSIDSVVYVNTIEYLRKQNLGLYNQMRQMREEYEKRIRGI